MAAGFGSSKPQSAMASITKTQSKITTTKNPSTVNVNSGMGASTNSTQGQEVNAENPLIQTTAAANAVAEWMKNVLANRTIISGDFRPDPRADAADRITVEDKYLANTLYLTTIKYAYNGAFTGSFEGRVM